MGPSLPKLVEYTCHPGSIVPEKMISPSPPFSSFSWEVKCTGSIIWACTVSKIRLVSSVVSSLRMQ